MKKLKKIVSVILSLVLINSILMTNANAFTNSNDISHYERILGEFNSFYGTDYAFDNPDNYSSNSQIYKDINENLSMISNMSDDEFWSYLYELHTNTFNQITLNDFTDEPEKLTISVRSLSEVFEQRHYYDGRSTRYVCFYMNMGYNGVYRYTGLDSCGDYVSNNDYYLSRTNIEVQNCTITNSGLNMRITYTYQKRLSAILVNTAYYTSTITFQAGGDDIWNYPTA